MKHLIYLAVLCFGMAACGENQQTRYSLQSPDSEIVVDFELIDGRPAYRVAFQGKEQISTSFMGFEFQDQPELGLNLEVSGVDQNTVNETWEMPWGEQREVANQYNELRVRLNETSGAGRNFHIVFRAFNDGIGFRYEFPKQEALSGDVIITEEKTEFNLTGDHKVWWIPGDWDIYEYLYTTSKFSEINAYEQFIPGDHLGQVYLHSNAVNTPLTMKTDDGIYLSFHEADLTDYAGMTLKVDTTNLSMVSELVGNAAGIKVKTTAPFVTPWRTVQIADRAGDLIESKMIVNLNDPNEIGDVSWFKPMKYLGIWWDMHLNRRTWDYASGNHGATTEYTKEFLDFAAEHGFGGVLVEGWNTGWETWTEPDMRDTIFDFTTPYPDYDLEYLANYAKSKGVQIIMHHETSGAVARYEERMDTAYQLMNKLGIHSVKTGYVGTIIPEGEYHHGQWMVNHYQKTLEYGAKYKVAINMHEPIKATGKRRTYPNAISREGVRGQEYNAWAGEGASPPEHLPIVAFTRMLAGPIDYTPGILNPSLLPYKENHPIKTTVAQQLGLYVTIYSPIQMAADLLEFYRGNPAFEFIKEVAVDWEQSKVLDGEPGDFLVMARQERGSENWFVGGMTDENPLDYTLQLDFLTEGTTYIAKIYRDAADTHYLDNPTAIDILEMEVTKGDEILVNMAAAGGFAVSLLPKE
ncbi:glycoside hydrolase family 97 protein [Marinoscillum furvescens]|uniref:Glycosyl hydrolase family 97 n=1 Tax=Marinoscillum furvescens DSM 4134 TaxID=1122208 RepID=A0A3D9KZU0_MARFU|nr:glycoside hydrolase family 97 protein [Marinoscillum furvescens]RED94080.1 glycosyl hydrolase family 97 [Marinoscillum furvescens DSM 4134]